MKNFLTRKLRCEITIFLALIFSVLVSFIFSMIVVTSIKCSKAYTHAISKIITESVFSEYSKEAYEDYGLFLIDGGYYGEYDIEKVKDRFKFYASRQEAINDKTNKPSGGNFFGFALEDVRLLGLEHATDNSFSNIRNQMLTITKNSLGNGWGSLLNIDPLLTTRVTDLGEEYNKDKQSNSSNFEGIDDEERSKIDDSKGILTGTKNNSTLDLLDLILGNEYNISAKSIEEKNVFSTREKIQGFGKVKTMEASESLERIATAYYLSQHLENASNVEGDKPLDYEIEYLLGGHKTDRENLKEVATKLLLLREGVNYAHLLTSPAKSMQASALATTLCAGVVAIEPIIKQTILLAWAFGESIVDLRMLLSGKKVAFAKTDTTWKLSLENITTLDADTSKDDEGGNLYLDYLRVLLGLSNQNEVMERFCDLVEVNLQSKEGLENFKIDGSIVGINLEYNWGLDNSINYNCSSEYFYK